MANWLYNLLHGKLPGQGFLGRSNTGNGAAELLSPSQATVLLPAATASNDGKMTAAQAGKLAQFSTESEYVRLGGRSGGQIIYGGTQSGENNTLHSNILKDGLIKLGDNSAYNEGNDRLGIGTTIPDAILSIPNYSTTTSQIHAGTLEAQSIGINNWFLADNAYYYGSFKARNTGGSMLQTGYSGGFEIRTSSSSYTAGDTISYVRPFRINPDGSIALGGNITQIGPFPLNAKTGAKLFIDTSGNLGVSQLSPTARTHIKGSTSDSSGYGLKVDSSTANTKNFYVRDDGRLETRDGGELSVGTTIGFKIGISTSEKLGFFGATPVAQQDALTASVTTLTHTAPGTPDYAIQNLTNSGGYGFATQDEGNTVLSVINNLQTRVNELETRVSNLGLIA